jgi:hypothetical protein
MHVLKMTFLNKILGGKMPTEAQFVTGYHRELMNVGEINHISYKSGVSPEEAADFAKSLERNRQRAGKMASAELVIGSRGRVEQVLKEIYRSRIELVGTTGVVAVKNLLQIFVGK